MGNFNITIRGVGIHHNNRRDDVEQMAADFVDKLRAAGHDVTGATVTTGGEDDVADRMKLYPVIDAEVTVNGQIHYLHREVTYDEIVMAAGYSCGRILSVIFKGAHEDRPEGILSPGEKVRVKAGTVFNVADTSNA